MTGPTTTTGIRISPQLWAEFGLLARSEGKTRNAALVDMIRERVIRSQFKPDKAAKVAHAAIKDTTTHSAKEEGV